MKIYVLEDDDRRIQWFRDRYLEPYALYIFKTVKELDDQLRKDLEYPRLNERPDIIFLDHDLGGKTYDDGLIETGMGAVDVLMFLPPDWCSIVVHSMNLPKAVIMQHTLQRAGFKVERIPFSELSKL